MDLSLNIFLSSCYLDLSALYFKIVFLVLRITFKRGMITVSTNDILLDTVFQLSVTLFIFFLENYVCLITGFYSLLHIEAEILKKKEAVHNKFNVLEIWKEKIIYYISYIMEIPNNE